MHVHLQFLHDVGHDCALYFSCKAVGHQVHVRNLLQTAFSHPLQEFLGEKATAQKLVTVHSCLLPSFLLDSSPCNLLGNAPLVCLHTLRLCQLSVTNLGEFVPLLLNCAELLLFKHLETGLIKRFINQNVKHGLSFSVKMEQLGVTIVYLLFFAALLRGLLRVEKQVWRSVHVEVSRNLQIGRWRLIS